MERTCEHAVELGLRSVAFTDHAEFTATTLLGDPALLPGLFRRWVRDGMLVPPPMPLEGYLECLERCRNRFPGLQILSGVELSEPQWHTGPAASLLRQGQFDVVICGQHTLPHEPGTWIDVVVAHRIHDPAEVVRRYLAELLGLVKGWDDFAALAHIDYAMRYWPRDRAVCPPANFEE